MAVARKLDPKEEQELARLLAVVKKADRNKPAKRLGSSSGNSTKPLTPMNPLAQSSGFDSENDQEEMGDQENTDQSPVGESEQAGNRPQGRQAAVRFVNNARNLIENNDLPAFGDKKFREDYDNFKKTSFGLKTPAGAIKEGIKLGLSLRRGLAEGAFSSFLLILLLAVIKDLWDVLDVSTLTGDIVGLFITTTVLVALSFQGTWFKRWLIKKYLKKYILAILAELIPGVAIFPTFTIMVLIIKFQNDKRMGQQKLMVEDYEEELAKLKV
ncbi:MAG: hypothetical protein WCV73_04010 [Patescibacteria group bacterium]